MERINVIGADVHKIHTQLVFLNIKGKMIGKKRLKTDHVVEYFSNHEQVKVGMEVSIGSQYLAKHLIKLGHEVKVMPARKIKAFYTGPKNDIRDAEAIGKAAMMEFVSGIQLKSDEALIAQSYLRQRQLVIKTRVSLCHQVRGILAEHGIRFPQGHKTFMEFIPQFLKDKNSSSNLKVFVRLAYQNIKLQMKIEKEWDVKLQSIAKNNAAAQRLQSIPGFGPLGSLAFLITIGNIHEYKRGRDISAFLGLVPKQFSSGEKTALGGINKKGASYTRTLLVHGARAFLTHGKKSDKNHQWLTEIKNRRGSNKAAVAWANKMARIGFALLKKEQDYERCIVDIAA